MKKGKVVVNITYTEEIGDLFVHEKDCYLCHCISADFGMGKGIVVEFNKRYQLKSKLVSQYKELTAYWDTEEKGFCLLEGKILNLITKRNYYCKPTYESMQRALNSMKNICIDNNIKNIAMPVIGCGLDKLIWSKVSEMIQQTFVDTNINIIVCKIC